MHNMKTSGALIGGRLWGVAALAFACAILMAFAFAPRAYAVQAGNADAKGAVAAATVGEGALGGQASHTYEAGDAVASSKYALLAKDGYLYPCSSKGQKLASWWDAASSKQPAKAVKVFVAADAKKIPTQVKYSVVDDLKTTTYTAGLGTLKSISGVTFLLKDGKNACEAVASKAFMSTKRLKAIKNFDKTQVAKIGEWAFGYSSLKSIALPKTLKAMGESAFAYCKSLANVKGMGKTALKVVPKWGFYGCSSLKSVALPKSCKVVRDSTFSACTKLAKVTLGAKTATLGTRAFYGCSSLKAISLPKSCKSIGTYCFARCSKLKTVTLNATKVVTHNDGAKYDLSGSFANTPISAAQTAKKDSGARVYVPSSLVKKYQTSAPWRFCKGIFSAIG